VLCRPGHARQHGGLWVPGRREDVEDGFHLDSLEAIVPSPGARVVPHAHPMAGLGVDEHLAWRLRGAVVADCLAVAPYQSQPNRAMTIPSITTRPGRQEVRRPAGAGWTICSGPTGIMQPPSPSAGPGRTPAPPMVLAHPVRPTSQTPTAGRAHDHAMIGAYVAVDLAALDSRTVADDLAQWADGLLWDEISRAFPAEHCRFFGAIADALDAVPDGIAEGVAWCARIAGAPEVIADLLGAIAKLTIESHVAPLHAVAQEIRLIGTARCAAEGADHLASCQCARRLVRSLSDHTAAAALDRVLAPAIERLKAVEMPSPVVGPTPVPNPPPTEPPSPSPFSPF
jgi:hypothetical protein